MIKYREIIFLSLIIIISVSLLFKMITTGIYDSHDGDVHIARMAQFDQALKEGQIPVRWLKNWNFGYGYPSFVFIYQSPYFISSFLHIIIESFEEIFKAMMIGSLFLSGIAFYYLAKRLVTPIAALVGSIFYISAPYRFADIFERGALAESIFFVVIPLLFLAILTIPKNKFAGFISTSLIFFIAITTHALSLLIFLPILIAFSALIFKKNTSFYLILFAGFVFSILLSAFNWMPMIYEQKYVNLQETYFDLFKGHFLNINQLLRIPSAQTNIGTGIQLGTAQTFVIVLSFAAIRKIRQAEITRPLFLLFLIFSTIAAFLTLDVSKNLWLTLRPLQALLFPWRFLVLTTFSSAVLASYLADQLSSKKIQSLLAAFVLILIALIPSRHFLKGQNWHSFDNNFYLNYQDRKRLDSYFLPKGLTPDFKDLNLPQISAIQGQSSIEVTDPTNDQITAQVNSAKSSTIQFHTIYFPGWQLYVDGQKSTISKEYPNLEGLIVAEVQSGYHKLDLKFEETPLRKTANYVTVTSLAIFLSILIIFARRTPWTISPWMNARERIHTSEY